MLGLVCLRRFPSHAVAEVARAALESHGIAATVSSPHLGWDITFAAGGAKLLVDEDSVQSAEEVLTSVQEISDLTESGFPEADSSNFRRTVIQIGVALLVSGVVVGWLFS